MHGVGMVDLVHADRFFVVIDGDIHGAAKRGLDAGAGTAAAGEVVDDEAHYPNTRWANARAIARAADAAATVRRWVVRAFMAEAPRSGT